LFDDAIISINEISKLNASFGSSVSAVGSQYKTGDSTTPISRTSFSTTSLNTSSYGVTTGSSSYMMGFNHDNGQFSVANIPFYRGGTTTTQFHVRPFTVNQTNGSITVGSASTIWSNGSGNCNSTNTWGQSGPYIFNTGNHCAPGNGSNTPVTTVAHVSGNSATGTYSNHSVYQPVLNGYSFSSFNGSTAYWAPSVYNQNNSNQPTLYTWSSSSNGGSLSNTTSSNYTSDTSTNYTYPIIRQNGTNGPTNGSLMIYRTASNGPMNFVILSNTASAVQTVATANAGLYTDSILTGTGFELSNGRTLFYLAQKHIILKNGNSISNVTETADHLPLSNNETLPSMVTPVATDTWIGVSIVFGVAQVVKFKINPTTYKITIIGSYPLLNYEPLFNNVQSATRLGAFITGNNNQYLVLVYNGNSDSAKVHVEVHQNSLSGLV
jgi:hypothetical protein